MNDYVAAADLLNDGTVSTANQATIDTFIKRQEALIVNSSTSTSTTTTHSCAAATATSPARVWSRWRKWPVTLAISP